MTASSARLGSCNRRPPLIATHEAFAQTKANPPRRPTPKPTTLPLKDHKNQHRSTPKLTKTAYPHYHTVAKTTIERTKERESQREVWQRKGWGSQREWWEEKAREKRESEERTRVSVREKPKLNDGVRVRLDLRAEMVSFVIFWTSLVFAQTWRIVSEIYLFFKKLF